MKEYYKAYDGRYKIFHEQTGSAWAGTTPSTVLKDMLIKNGANLQSKILEIGCGEGQNALFLQENGFDIVATDVSNEAVDWCKRCAKEKGLRQDKFFVLDILNNNLDEKYDFILAISTLHMLVLDSDRKTFFDFVFSHLKDEGVAIVTSMGDGERNDNNCDINKAYELVARKNGDNEFMLPNTSYRIVDWKTLESEIENSNLNINEKHISHSISGFNNSMVVVLQRRK